MIERRYGVDEAVIDASRPRVEQIRAADSDQFNWRRVTLFAVAVSVAIRRDCMPYGGTYAAVAWLVVQVADQLAILQRPVERYRLRLPAGDAVDVDRHVDQMVTNGDKLRPS